MVYYKGCFKIPWTSILEFITEWEIKLLHLAENPIVFIMFQPHSVNNYTTFTTCQSLLNLYKQD